MSMFLGKVAQDTVHHIAQDNDEPVQCCISQLYIETGSYVQLSNTPAATHTAWNGCP
jgi:hypothetical protein